MRLPAVSSARLTRRVWNPLVFSQLVRRKISFFPSHSGNFFPETFPTRLTTKSFAVSLIGLNMLPTLRFSHKWSSSAHLEMTYWWDCCRTTIREGENVKWGKIRKTDDTIMFIWWKENQFQHQHIFLMEVTINTGTAQYHSLRSYRIFRNVPAIYHLLPVSLMLSLPWKLVCNSTRLDLVAHARIRRWAG